MSPGKVVAWIVGGIGLIVLVVLLAFGGTYVAYFIAAMQRPPASPFSITCSQAGAPRGNTVPLRFDISNSSRKDATWMNFALFARADHRNLSDWGYVLETRVPAGGKVSKVVAVPLPSDYRGVRFASVQCNLINAVFADGSQQSYGANTDSFP
ncbi:MAG: hypothetical protein JO263_00130 [Candidatus Eremiobacteraeota bacterium]|nr:hypothetical protein [Candidatus Eremiobacteraeota bacterium]